MSSDRKLRLVPPAETLGASESAPSELSGAEQRETESWAEQLRATASPAALDEVDHEVLLALTLGEDAVDFSDEQLRLGAELAEAIDARQERRSGSADRSASGELEALVELAEALHAATGRGELDEISHERLLQRALRQPGRERGAGRRSTLLATVAAVAAGIALFWGTTSLVDDGARSVAVPHGGAPRPGPAVELIRSRSTQSLFDRAIPLSPAWRRERAGRHHRARPCRRASGQSFRHVGGAVMGRARPATDFRVAVLGLVLAATAGMAGCSSEQPNPPGGASQPCAPCSCAPAGVVDVSLLAFLSKARAAHHQADIAEQSGKSVEAIRPLARLVAEAVPGGSKPAPEVREVLADTYARLAELRSRLGEFVPAQEDLERGLRLAAERTHFRGRLLEVRGLVEERHAKKLAADGDDDGARAANARAVASFEQAIEVQADVIEQTLADAGVPPLPGADEGDSGPAAGSNR